MTLRIDADFNSCLEDSRGFWCWCLRHNERILDECTEELGLYDGMPVVIFYQDELEEFEYDAILGHSLDVHWMGMWMARFEQSTFRRIR
jgi:hypothetical protein